MHVKTIVASAMLLLLPLSFMMWSGDTAGIEADGWAAYAITWVHTKSDLPVVGETSETKSISGDWFEESGYYDAYLGNWIWGALILLLAAVALGLAIVRDEVWGPTIILVTVVLFLILRTLQLNEDHTSWFDSTDSGWSEYSYWELPLLPIVAAVLALMDMAEKKHRK